MENNNPINDMIAAKIKFDIEWNEYQIKMAILNRKYRRSQIGVWVGVAILGASYAAELLLDYLK